MQLSREQLYGAYSQMRLIREFEERLHVEFPKGEIPGFVHLYAGEEASAAGVCMNLDERDAIASTHRGHGHAIAKGCDIDAMMAEIYGKGTGLCGGKGGSMHIADFDKGMMGANGIVGGGPPLVCGAALAAKYSGTGGVAVAFVGDGGSNQGTTLESLNFASVLKLPVLFVFENNEYGQTSSYHWAVGGGDIVNRGPAFGIPAVQVDGTDFFAVHAAAADAVAHARAGKGPMLLELKLSRYYGHFEGDAQSYRGPGEIERLRREYDPLINFRNKTLAAGLVEESRLDEIDAESKRRIDKAVEGARAAPPPPKSTLTTNVYVSY